jgi:hypothetical protein
MIEFYQGGVMKTRIKLAAMGLLFSGLLTACEGITSQGDIKAEIPNPLPSDWTAAAMPSSANWFSVAYGGASGQEKFVAVATAGSQAAYSANGTNWTASPTGLPDSAYWRSVAYGGGKFVAIAYDSNKAAYSTDGINWTASPTGLPSSAYWYSVAYGGGKFVAVANGSNKAAYSTDGLNWTAATLPSSANWYCVAYGGGKFVAVATAGSQAAYHYAITMAKLVFNANGTVTWARV